MDKKEDLAVSLAETLNKKFKTDGKVAYFIGEEETPTDIHDWISTGSSTLDLAISNRPHGGIPVGRIIELNGLEASGKSLVAAHLLASTQKKGGVAVYIDTENALSMEFLEAIGIDVSRMLYVQLDTVESIFDAIESIISKIRESDKGKLVAIVVDSLAASTTATEKESDYSKDGWATGKAIIISKAMRKITQLIGKERISLIFTNQLRVKLGAMFGDPYTTSGGKALPFHASVRVRLKTMGQIKVKTAHGDQPIGVKVRAQVIKNRIGPPLRVADFNVYFDKGIDDTESWLEVLKNMDLIKRSNPGSKVVDEDGIEYKFTNDKWAELLETNPKLKDYLYRQICDSVIMDYTTNGLDSEVFSTEEVVGDD